RRFQQGQTLHGETAATTTLRRRGWRSGGGGTRCGRCRCRRFTASTATAARSLASPAASAALRRIRRAAKTRAIAFDERLARGSGDIADVREVLGRFDQTDRRNRVVARLRVDDMV